MAKQYRSCRSFAMALPAALMFYGIPTLLAVCVLSGVGVFGWLVCRAVRENKKKRQDI